MGEGHQPKMCPYSQQLVSPPLSSFSDLVLLTLLVVGHHQLVSMAVSMFKYTRFSSKCLILITHCLTYLVSHNNHV